MALVFAVAPGSAHPSTATTPAVTSANASSFVYAPGATGGAISAMHYTKGDAGALTLTVYGMPPQPGGSSFALVSADLYNGEAQTVTFPGGAAVKVSILRNGQSWKDVVIDQPSPASLEAGQRVHLQTTEPLDGAATYDVSGRLVGRGGH